MRASRPGYGLKELEALPPISAVSAEIQDGGTSIIVFEQWMQTRDPALLAQIDEYNREDCIATRLLRDWLLERRAEALERFGPFPLPEPEEPKPMPPEKAARAELRSALLGAGEELAAQLLDYHDRERKPVWWAFFDRIEMTPAELVEDADSIGRLSAGRGAGAGRPLARVHAQLPGAGAQDRRGAEHDRSGDAEGRRARSSSSTGRSAGSCSSAARASRRSPLPEALVPGRPYDTKDQEDALERLGRSLLAGDRRYPALESILRREPFDRPVQTSDLDEMKELVLSLDGRHLVIQGPPGSGKTWTSRAADRAPAGARQARRRRLDEPQGDPQPARRGRGGRRGVGRRTSPG